jgi:hypothetical protein
MQKGIQQKEQEGATTTNLRERYNTYKPELLFGRRHADTDWSYFDAKLDNAGSIL